ncbi:unnamed protein product [Protopolystoma xenopodis]|uniref:Uncharacterized protein n=1 Tax=Protopolystoma xenopodis TaxID=117903 RepID=A0A448XJ33_9PLAT|nr:unnamed protein product [Protopolystoma xenopodis]
MDIHISNLEDTSCSIASPLSAVSIHPDSSFATVKTQTESLTLLKTRLEVWSQHIIRLSAYGSLSSSETVAAAHSDVRLESPQDQSLTRSYGQLAGPISDRDSGPEVQRCLRALGHRFTGLLERANRLVELAEHQRRSQSGRLH